jgi:hypothetical protein
LRLDPIDIVASPDYQAANLWFAQGAPQPVFTAHTKPLPITPTMQAARAHHEHQQRQRGYHPHDHGRYIQPPLVRSTDTPILARHRTVHVDLTGWANCPPPEEIHRVVVVLQPVDGGPPHGVTCQPEDESGRRYHAQLTDRPGEVSRVAVGRYRTTVLAWAAGEGAPRAWTPGGAGGLAVDVADEPARPLGLAA